MDPSLDIKGSGQQISKKKITKDSRGSGSGDTDPGVLT